MTRKVHAMHLGLIGLGKMGGNMRERIRASGHTVVGYDRTPRLSDVKTLKAMVAKLPAPRVVWVMVPAGAATDETITALAGLLSEGDLVVDGGNTKFTDDITHAKELGAKGIGLVDCGVSGGIWGVDNGYGLMCGGDPEHVAMVMPIFDALRPEGPRDEGFVHSGDVGAGHYVKMVHNGIEYGLMQAYAEGFELLLAKDTVKDVPGSFKAWTRGTVVRSWLLDLMVDALEEDPDLGKIKGFVNDSGEGRWTLEEGIEHAVPMPVIAAALFARFTSRQDDSPQMRAVAALRNQFGGHAVTKAGEAGVLTDH
ncbi:MAG: phosphogluconate dehydrogenase (NAD(+)-dependent, decarboxylating) [Dermatophilaceae bacterium]